MVFKTMSNSSYNASIVTVDFFCTSVLHSNRFFYSLFLSLLWITIYMENCADCFQIDPPYPMLW